MQKPLSKGRESAIRAIKGSSSETRLSPSPPYFRAWESLSAGIFVSSAPFGQQSGPATPLLTSLRGSSQVSADGGIIEQVRSGIHRQLLSTADRMPCGQGCPAASLKKTSQSQFPVSFSNNSRSRVVGCVLSSERCWRPLAEDMSTHLL